MNHMSGLIKLRADYLAKIQEYGQKIKKWNSPEFKSVKQTLLRLNRKHKVEAINIYAKLISQIDKPRKK